MEARRSNYMKISADNRWTGNTTGKLSQDLNRNDEYG
jgi:hypothetical protein